MVSWVVFLGIGLLVGVVAGYFFGRLDDSGDRKSVILKHSLAESEKNFQEYQQQVQKHFMKTGELVNAMTKTYSEVHAHLAESAKALCEYPPADTALERVSLQSLEIEDGFDKPVVSERSVTKVAASEPVAADAHLAQAESVSADSSPAHETPTATTSKEERIVH